MPPVTSTAGDRESANELTPLWTDTERLTHSLSSNVLTVNELCESREHEMMQ